MQKPISESELIFELTELYADLTDSRNITVKIESDKIEIRIVAQWFALQSPEERIEYLLEGLDVFLYPAIKAYQVKFIPIVPN